jgi:CheY-like chemotaxis protein
MLWSQASIAAAWEGRAVPRILVLDDEPMISMMVQDWLTELDCETVGPAHTVRSALDFVDAVVLDGALLDVSLGNEECYSVADALHDHGVPFAFATGYGDNGLPDRFKDSLILSKPFDFEAVRGIIGKLLDNHARS